MSIDLVELSINTPYTEYKKQTNKKTLFYRVFNKFRFLQPRFRNWLTLSNSTECRFENGSMVISDKVFVPHGHALPETKIRREICLKFRFLAIEVQKLND